MDKTQKIRVILMYAIIYNPLSGGFNSNTLNGLQALLEKRGHSCKLMPTQYASHATELACKCAEENVEAIISYGGDGTTYEVLNGMAKSGVTLLIAPSGTGNDLIRTLGLPRDTLKALEIQLDCAPCKMDAISVNDRWHVNVSGMGPDVLVLREYERLRSRMFGSLAYRLAILLAIGKFKPEKVRMSLDGSPMQLTPYTFLSFGNGRYFGGGMKCLPFADPFDGKIDVLYITPISRLFICCILPIFFSGKHTGLKPVKYMHAKSIVLDADEPFWMQLDGELYQTQHAEINIHPGLLNMRLPR